MDFPRFAAPLVAQLAALGGIRYLYLTHRDDGEVYWAQSPCPYPSNRLPKTSPYTFPQPLPSDLRRRPVVPLLQ